MLNGFETVNLIKNIVSLFMIIMHFSCKCRWFYTPLYMYNPLNDMYLINTSISHIFCKMQNVLSYLCKNKDSYECKYYKDIQHP